MATAVLVPELTGWDVHVRWFPPLHADWDPRLGPGTLPASLLATAGAVWAVPLADRLPWRWLLLVAFLVGLAWMLSLAYVDGRHGVGAILDTGYEYLPTARRTTDLSATLPEYVSRIGYDAEPRNWPVHIAGHPPGALVFFVVLVRLGLGSALTAGLVVTTIAATTSVAVLVTARVLGAERLARRAAPFLVLGPAAVWQAVSADAVFAAVGAWGIAALSVATTRRGGSGITWSVLAGLLLGYAVLLSYGLPILGLIAVTVLLLGRTWRPLPVAALAALAVVGIFASLGFSYLEALPEIHERYWDGVASARPTSYWLWANLAALMFSAGPMAGAGLAELAGRLGRWRRSRPTRVVAGLGAAGWAMVLTANLSLMSKAEVERIWLPFVPWLLLPLALLPEPWRRRGLVVQLATALLVQHLLDTGW